MRKIMQILMVICGMLLLLIFYNAESLNLASRLITFFMGNGLAVYGGTLLINNWRSK